MGDIYIRLIPTDPGWQPTIEAADTAVRYVEKLFAGPAAAVERVEHIFYDSVTLIDSGEYTGRITCPHCKQDVDPDCFWETLGRRLPALNGLNIEVSCCCTLVALDSLRYEGLVGFARFEVSAMNWTRANWGLEEHELEAVSALLGHVVTQVLASY